MEKEQTSTEIKNSRIARHTRQEVSRFLVEEYETRLRNEEKNKKIEEQIKLYGRNGAIISEYRNKGKAARIAAIPFNANVFDNDIIRNNFRAGFVENGNRILIGMIDQFTPQQLELYGKNDYISGIQPDEIPNVLKTNNIYMTAYNTAKENSVVVEQSVKKGR